MFRTRFALIIAASAFAAALAGCNVKFDVKGGANPQDNSKAGGAKEDPAERDLKRLDGKVKRDKSQPDNPVVEIRLFSDKVTDDDLKELAQFTKLRRLEFSGNDVTGTGLAALTELPIEELHIMFAKGITNDGMKEIAKIKSLKVLNLPQGKFDDDGLKEIATLTNLEELTVSGFKIGDRGFYPLKTLTKLRKVNANNCNVGDGAMKTLSGLPELRVLELYGSAVTDTGYGYVGKMAKLEELQTSYKITDKGVAHLGNLKNLKKLNVWNSNVTIKGIRALPNLKNFKELDISTWNIKAEEADKLRDELPDCNIAYSK
jgi:internalin A